MSDVLEYEDSACPSCKAYEFRFETPLTTTPCVFCLLFLLQRCRHNAPVRESLVTRMRASLPDGDLEFVIPQICQMLLAWPARDAVGLTDFIVERAGNCIHLAIKLMWWLDAASHYLSTTAADRAQSLMDRIEMHVVNSPIAPQDVALLADPRALNDLLTGAAPPPDPAGSFLEDTSAAGSAPPSPKAAALVRAAVGSPSRLRSGSSTASGPGAAASGSSAGLGLSSGMGAEAAAAALVPLDLPAAVTGAECSSSGSPLGGSASARTGFSDKANEDEDEDEADRAPLSTTAAPALALAVSESSETSPLPPPLVGSNSESSHSLSHPTGATAGSTSEASTAGASSASARTAARAAAAARVAAAAIAAAAEAGAENGGAGAQTQAEGSTEGKVESGAEAEAEVGAAAVTAAAAGRSTDDAVEAPVRPLDEGELSLFVTKQVRAAYFTSMLGLAKQFHAISDRLLQHRSRPSRKALLPRLLTALRPLGLYLPLFGAEEPHHALRRFFPQEAVVLNSRDKAPFLLWAEIETLPGVASGDSLALAAFSAAHRARFSRRLTATVRGATGNTEDLRTGTVATAGDSADWSADAAAAAAAAGGGRGGVVTIAGSAGAEGGAEGAHSQAPSPAATAATVAGEDGNALLPPAPLSLTGLRAGSVIIDDYVRSDGATVTHPTLPPSLAASMSPSPAPSPSPTSCSPAAATPALSPSASASAAAASASASASAAGAGAGASTDPVSTVAASAVSAAAGSTAAGSTAGHDVWSEVRPGGLYDPFGERVEDRAARLLAPYDDAAPSTAATLTPGSTSAAAALAAAEAEGALALPPPRGDVALLSAIFKGGDDCRQEVLAMQLIELFAQIFQEAGLPLQLRPYSVLVTSWDSGLIETVPNTSSVDGVKKTIPGCTSLADFFAAYFGPLGSERHLEAQRNFVQSMAGYALVSHFLQVKDRHNGNILVDADGRVVHIDFGFMLSSSPGGNMNFENVPFKLTEEYVRVMGGELSEAFATFRMLFIRGFLEARKHAHKFLLLVELLLEANIQAFVRGRAAVDDMRARFCLDMEEGAVVEHAVGLVEKSCNHWLSARYDHYQKVTNGIL